MSKQNGFLFFYDWEEPFTELDGESFKSLFLAMLKYQRDGTPPPNFDGAARIISSFVFPQLERRLASSKGGKIGMAKRYESTENVTENATLNKSLNKSLNNKSLTQDKDKTRQKQDKDTPPKSPKGEKSEIEKRFLQFWEVYPRKQAIANARKAFEKIKPDETLSDTIIKAVEAQKKCEQWQNSKYIPLPASWLNAEEWKDETQTATAQRQVNTTPSNISLLDKYL